MVGWPGQVDMHAENLEWLGVKYGRVRDGLHFLDVARDYRL